MMSCSGYVQVVLRPSYFPEFVFLCAPLCLWSQIRKNRLKMHYAIFLSFLVEFHFCLKSLASPLYPLAACPMITAWSLGATWGGPKHQNITYRVSANHRQDGWRRGRYKYNFTHRTVGVSSVILARFTSDHVCSWQLNKHWGGQACSVLFCQWT